MAQIGMGVFALLLLEAVCAPGDAYAGCNHQVASRSDSLLTWNRLDELNGAIDSSTGAPIPLDSAAPGRQKPCSGMSCSSRDNLPASTTSPRSNGPDHWGALDLLTTSDAKFPSFDRLDDPALLVTGEKASIFHPPRV